MEGSSLSELTPIVFNMKLTHPGSKASIYNLIAKLPSQTKLIDT